VVAEHDDVVDDHVTDGRGAAAEDVDRRAPVFARLFGAERALESLVEGFPRRVVVLAGDEEGDGRKVDVRPDVHDDRHLRAKPRPNVLMTQARALERGVEHVVDLLPDPLIVAQRGEPIRERHQVDLLASRRIEVSGEDDLARCRDELEKLLARPTHQEESGRGPATPHDQQRRQQDHQPASRAAGGGRGLVTLGPGSPGRPRRWSQTGALAWPHDLTDRWGRHRYGGLLLAAG
jgi:hypothetical protein